MSRSTYSHGVLLAGRSRTFLVRLIRRGRIGGFLKRFASTGTNPPTGICTTLLMGADSSSRYKLGSPLAAAVTLRTPQFTSSYTAPGYGTSDVDDGEGRAAGPTLPEFADSIRGIRVFDFNLYWGDLIELWSDWGWV